MSDEARCTVTVTIHPWCHDIPRDEAVRAAEDGRSGPLPTLEECIAGVTERRPVDAGGGGNVTLRTELVTLEVTHGAKLPARAWGWCNAFRGLIHPGESIRVVEEAHFDDLAQVAMERDAAIRERDTLRSERITQALTADRFAAAVAEADTLRARVAELESSAPAASVVPSVIGDITEIIRSNADADEKHAALSTLVEAVCPGWRLAPAASGAAGTGWLTADERLAVSGAILILDQHGPTNIGRSLNSLLARSSPPEVVLEDFTPDAVLNLDAKYLAGWYQCMALAKRAISAAGVAVKEVGH